MAQQLIGVGSVANDGTGDPLRTAFTKINSNETQLFQGFNPGPIAGNYSIPIFNGTFQGGSTITASTIYLTLAYIPAKITINALVRRVTTLSAGGNFQLAIYANNVTTGRPTGTALTSTANMSTAATGNISATVTNVQLDQGWYWWATNIDNSTAILASYSLGSLGIAQTIGTPTLATIFGGSGAIVALSTVQTFGTWPDLTSASFTELTSNNIGVLVAYKIASVP